MLNGFYKSDTMLDFFWRHPSLVTGSLVVFLYSGYCPMSHSGFYCNDDSITFKRATIEAFDVKLLLFICIVPMMALVSRFSYVSINH